PLVDPHHIPPHTKPTGWDAGEITPAEGRGQLRISEECIDSAGLRRLVGTLWRLCREPRGKAQLMAERAEPASAEPVGAPWSGVPMSAPPTVPRAAGCRADVRPPCTATPAMKWETL